MEESKGKNNNICYFERLSPDIHYLILSYFKTPTDFYNLIRASPLHFRIYFCDREHYLHSIILQCYDRINLILALRILTVGRRLPSLKEKLLVEFETPHGVDRADWISNHLTCHTYETQSLAYDDPLSVLGMEEEKSVLDHEKLAHTVESTKMRRLRQLCRLWRLIDYFIHDYSRQAFKQLRRIRLRPEIKPGCTPVFSSDDIYRYGVSGKYRHRLRRHEYDRMQRAFLYFELYRRLFGRRQPHVPPEADTEYGDRLVSMEQHDFGKGLMSNENAELLSIYEYVASRITEVFGHVKRHVDNWLSILDNRDDVRGAEYLLNRQLLWFLRDNDASRPETITFLVELGLPFCRRFFLMPVLRQGAVIYRHRCNVRQPSLTHILAFSMNRNTHAERRKYIYDNRVCSYLRSSTLVSDVRTGRQEPGDKRNRYDETTKYERNIHKSRYGLGRAGLFFWDDERIYGLRSRGRFGWLHYIGCFLWKDALRSGLEAGASRSNIGEDFSDDAVPWELLPGDEILEEADDQDSNDDDFTRAKRESQRPDLRATPLKQMLDFKIDLKDDSFDY